MAIAIGKSNPDPDFGNHAGESATVVFLFCHLKLEFESAVRTRSLDSFRAASGRPRRVKLGKPSEISTSTEISSPTNPINAIELLLKTGN